MSLLELYTYYCQSFVRVISNNVYPNGEYIQLLQCILQIYIIYRRESRLYLILTSKGLSVLIHMIDVVNAIPHCFLYLKASCFITPTDVCLFCWWSSMCMVTSYNALNVCFSVLTVFRRSLSSFARSTSSDITSTMHTFCIGKNVL